jgi:hypothetical protein
MTVIDFNGFIVLGGYTTQDVVPFKKVLLERFKSYEYEALDTLFNTVSQKLAISKEPLLVSLLDNDSLLDPRVPFTARYSLFIQVLKMLRRYPNLVIVGAVTYRNFLIGGCEAVTLKYRLDKFIYRLLDYSVECRKSNDKCLARAFDFANQTSFLLTTKNTYCEDVEWFRASSDCVCSVCGKVYREHPEDGIFHELCSGQLVKL